MKKRQLGKSTAGDAIREEREKLGWTRKRAAEAWNVKLRTLESWELGYRKPPALHLLQKLWADKRRVR